MAEKKKKLGFVILTWNSEHVIEACLRSVFQMRSFDIRAVVIDNGSSDESGRIVRRLQEELEGVPGKALDLITLDRNCGTTVSRNLGLRALAGFSPDYYCILDSDTVVNEEAFRILAAELDGHPRYGLVGPRMVSKNGAVQNSARAFPTFSEKVCKAIPLKYFQMKGDSLEHLPPPPQACSSYPADYLMSACWLMRPELLDRAGYLDERIFYAPEDAEYCIRVWKCGFQAAYCPEAVIVHEWQRLSRKKYFSRMNWEHIRGLAYMFRKHRLFLNEVSLERKRRKMKEKGAKSFPVSSGL